MYVCMWSDDRSDSFWCGALARGEQYLTRTQRETLQYIDPALGYVGACHAITLKDAVFTKQSQGRLLVTEQCTDAARLMIRTDRSDAE